MEKESFCSCCFAFFFASFTNLDGFRVVFAASWAPLSRCPPPTETGGTLGCTPRCAFDSRKTKHAIQRNRSHFDEGQFSVRIDTEQCGNVQNSSFRLFPTITLSDYSTSFAKSPRINFIKKSTVDLRIVFHLLHR